MIEAKKTALKDMQEIAKQSVANKVIEIDIDYEAFNSGVSMLMVSVSGTAVIIKPFYIV